MNLKTFKEIINQIPESYNDVQVSFICKDKVYFVHDYDNIEWYEDDLNNNEKMIDITLSREGV